MGTIPRMFVQLDTHETLRTVRTYKNMKRRMRNGTTQRTINIKSTKTLTTAANLENKQRTTYLFGACTAYSELYANTNEAYRLHPTSENI